jgi:formyltetrahydrofolate hydrolase
MVESGMQSFDPRESDRESDIIQAGQKLEARVLVKAVRIYLTKRLDVYWGIIKEV